MSDPEKKQQEDQSETEAATPLVFISHDNRDAKLAEAFSELLRSASMSMLKSFRSSDKHGTEGIQYGDEWYKRLMENLDKASDVVCLFTEQSLGRPWILFEAGVAKGKLATPVHGLALGVPLDKVSKGPFFQFQNCQDDEDGLTGLVMQLLKRIPNAEPTPESVGTHVSAFRNKAKSLLEKAGASESDADSGGGESSAAQLFEEIKVMVRDIPSTIEGRMEGISRVMGKSRLRRFHPAMFEEMVQMMPHMNPSDPALPILIMVGILHDEAPWLYELGVDVYRTYRSNSESDFCESVRQFRSVAEMTLHGPLSEMLMMRSKETYMMVRELERFMEMTLDRMMDRPMGRKRRPNREGDDLAR